MYNNPILQFLANNINNDLAAKSLMKIGATIKHPDGRKVKIISGYFLDPTYGRVSNWWSWREVKKNGKLGKIENGYGW